MQTFTKLGLDALLTPENCTGSPHRSPAISTGKRKQSRAHAYVWAHVNFLNLFNDDPKDTGLAGVDIYKMDADGKAIEHWDTLQLVGDPKNSAPWVAPNIPAANRNGMF